jgi:pyruvate dehydrogenase E2 component (dihydrolipoamide acetyltransferase)
MIEFRMPSLGADMDEGMLVAWLVSPGDVVRRGQVIAEVETEKGIIEVECWDDGTVVELLVEPGPEPLRVGTPLARLEPVQAGKEGVPLEEPTAETEEPDMERHVAAPGAITAAPGPPSRPVPPPIRHLARDLGVDLAEVMPSGGDGRVTREDVRRAAAAPQRVRATPRARRRAEESGIALDEVEATRHDGLITESDVLAAEVPAAPPPALPASEEGIPPAPTTAQGEDERAAGMRRAIARSMARSKREIPHYYLASHIDVEPALRWLEALNETRPITGRILPAALLLKATALALREMPELNGHFVDGDFRRSDDIHLGVAVALREGGLVAPAIHEADRLTLDELMARLFDLVTRARTWRLRSSEMSDATITVTNLGDRGVETAFPVIIPPQVAIVGYGRITEEPVVIDGAVTVRRRVHASLAADHRVTDGHCGGLFLAAVDRLLHEPEDL